MSHFKQLLTSIIYNDNNDLRIIWKIPMVIIAIPLKIIFLFFGVIVNILCNGNINDNEDDLYTDYDESWV